MNKMYEKISHSALRNVSLALPDPRTCSPWSTTFRGKTGSPPVATLTLSPLEGTAVMLWAARQNCGPAEDTLSTEAKSRVKLTIYESNRLCISLEKVLEVAALHHKLFMRILEKLFDWYQRSVPSGTLQNRRERGGDGQLSFSMLHLAWKFAAWNRK